MDWKHIGLTCVRYPEGTTLLRHSAIISFCYRRFDRKGASILQRHANIHRRSIRHAYLLQARCPHGVSFACTLEFNVCAHICRYSISSVSY